MYGVAGLCVYIGCGIFVLVIFSSLACIICSINLRNSFLFHVLSLLISLLICLMALSFTLLFLMFSMVILSKSSDVSAFNNLLITSLLSLTSLNISARSFLLVAGNLYLLLSLTTPTGLVFAYM